MSIAEICAIFPLFFVSWVQAGSNSLTCGSDDRKVNSLSAVCVLSVDNLCKQFGPRSGLTRCQAWSGSNLFDSQILFLKEFLENINFEKNQQSWWWANKKHVWKMLRFLFLGELDCRKTISPIVHYVTHGWTNMPSMCRKGVEIHTFTTVKRPIASM